MSKFLIGFFLVAAMFPFGVFAQETDAQTLDFGLLEQMLEESIETLPTSKVKQSEMVPFTEEALSNPNDWRSEFENVIWINKASKGRTAQKLFFYRNGHRALVTSISSGREQWEQAGPREAHKPSRSYFSTTGIGYFNVNFLSRNHVSNLWGTSMPFAVFFNGGIAVHQVPRGAEGKLGSRASGGCVRADAGSARWIFETVENSGKGSIPRFTYAGRPMLDGKGVQRRKTGYRTLVIVEERYD